MPRSRPIEREISMAEAAAEANISRRRMLRRLKAAHNQHGGVLVQHWQGSRKEYFTTRAALRKAFPEWFDDDPSTSAELEELKGEVADLKRDMRAMAARLRDYHRQAREWFLNGPQATVEGQKTQPNKCTGQRESSETEAAETAPQ